MPPGHGGALRLVDDDVRQRLVYLANGDNIVPARVPERRQELTSRIPAKDIAKLLTQMEETLLSGNVRIPANVITQSGRS